MGSPFSPHSAQAQSIAAVFSLWFVIAIAIFLIVAVGVIYSIVRFRASRQTAGEPRQIFGSTRVEIAWTVIPLLILTGLFVVTVRAMIAVDAPQDTDHPPDIVVTGHQWWWEARYPNGMVVPWDVHIPAEHRLRARIESADVIHDFWAPELARKMDAVPGRWGYIWLEADAPGTYSGTCAEFCGAEHAWMRFRVIAEGQPAYDAWVQREIQPSPKPTGVAADGARLFQTKQCADCHTVTATAHSSGKGPSLAHIASREFLAGGISKNTPDNLMLWLTDPQAAKPGNRMPNTPLSGDERRALLAYLESLR